MLPVTVILHNIRSLHNVGAIFRTCDAAGVEKIIVSGLTPAPPRHEIEKTALGATRTVAWEKVGDLPKKLSELKQRGYTLVALEQTPTSTDLFKHRPTFPIALVVGHEREGVENEILDHCDTHLEIPMRGQSAHSLNVGSSAAIALYELGRHLWYHEVAN